VQVVVALREREAAAAAQAVARQAGATLVPQHPGVDDPDLSRWFVAELADQAAAERLIAALLALDEVDGAYAKPLEEPPG
jgi:hypothetical protein